MYITQKYNIKNIDFTLEGESLGELTGEGNGRTYGQSSQYTRECCHIQPVMNNIVNIY